MMEESVSIPTEQQPEAAPQCEPVAEPAKPDQNRTVPEGQEKPKIQPEGDPKGDEPDKPDKVSPEGHKVENGEVQKENKDNQEEEEQKGPCGSTSLESYLKGNGVSAPAQEMPSPFVYLPPTSKEQDKKTAENSAEKTTPKSKEDNKASAMTTGKTENSANIKECSVKLVDITKSSNEENKDGEKLNHKRESHKEGVDEEPMAKKAKAGEEEEEIEMEGEEKALKRSNSVPATKDSEKTLLLPPPPPVPTSRNVEKLLSPQHEGKVTISPVRPKEGKLLLERPSPQGSVTITKLSTGTSQCVESKDLKSLLSSGVSDKTQRDYNGIKLKTEFMQHRSTVTGVKKSSNSYSVEVHKKTQLKKLKPPSIGKPLLSRPLSEPGSSGGGSGITCSKCNSHFSTKEAIKLHTCNSLLDQHYLTDSGARVQDKSSSSSSNCSPLSSISRNSSRSNSPQMNCSANSVGKGKGDGIGEVKLIKDDKDSLMIEGRPKLTVSKVSHIKTTEVKLGSGAGEKKLKLKVLPSTKTDEYDEDEDDDDEDEEDEEEELSKSSKSDNNRKTSSPSFTGKIKIKLPIHNPEKSTPSPAIAMSSAGPQGPMKRPEEEQIFPYAFAGKPTYSPSRVEPSNTVQGKESPRDASNKDSPASQADSGVFSIASSSSPSKDGTTSGTSPDSPNRQDRMPYSDQGFPHGVKIPNSSSSSSLKPHPLSTSVSSSSSASSSFPYSSSNVTNPSLPPHMHYSSSSNTTSTSTASHNPAYNNSASGNMMQQQPHMSVYAGGSGEGAMRNQQPGNYNSPQTNAMYMQQQQQQHLMGPKGPGPVQGGNNMEQRIPNMMNNPNSNPGAEGPQRQYSYAQSFFNYNPEPPAKRKRGRPRKNPLEPAKPKRSYNRKKKPDLSANDGPGSDNSVYNFDEDEIHSDGFPPMMRPKKQPASGNFPKKFFPGEESRGGQRMFNPQMYANPQQQYAAMQQQRMQYQQQHHYGTNGGDPMQKDAVENDDYCYESEPLTKPGGIGIKIKIKRETEEKKPKKSDPSTEEFPGQRTNMGMMGGAGPEMAKNPNFNMQANNDSRLRQQQQQQQQQMMQQQKMQQMQQQQNAIQSLNNADSNSSSATQSPNNSLRSPYNNVNSPSSNSNFGGMNHPPNSMMSMYGQQRPQIPQQQQPQQQPQQPQGYGTPSSMNYPPMSQRYRMPNYPGSVQQEQHGNFYGNNFGNGMNMGAAGYGMQQHPRFNMQHQQQYYNQQQYMQQQNMQQYDSNGQWYGNSGQFGGNMYQQQQQQQQQMMMQQQQQRMMTPGCNSGDTQPIPPHFRAGNPQPSPVMEGCPSSPSSIRLPRASPATGPRPQTTPLVSPQSEHSPYSNHPHTPLSAPMTPNNFGRQNGQIAVSPMPGHGQNILSSPPMHSHPVVTPTMEVAPSPREEDIKSPMLKSPQTMPPSSNDLRKIRRQSKPGGINASPASREPKSPKMEPLKPGGSFMEYSNEFKEEKEEKPEEIPMPKFEAKWEELPERAIYCILRNGVAMEGSVPFVTRASQVCTKWNKVVKDTSRPTLWSHMDLSSGRLKEKYRNEKKLETFLSRFPNILEVKLTGWKNAVSTSTLKILAAACPKLISLSLASCFKLSNEDLKLIGESFPNLERIDLSNVSSSSCSSRSAVSSTCLSDFIAVVGKRLTHLNLSNNKMSGLPFVFDALSIHSSNLEELDISNITMYSRDVISIHLEKFQKGCQKLRVLNANHTMITLQDTPIKEQVHALGFPQLRELYIAVDSRGYFDGLDDSQIERVLKKSDQLRVLDVRGCQNVTDSCLIRMPTWSIERLILSGCSAASYSCDSVELMVQKWTKLQEIDLGTTPGERPVNHGILEIATNTEVKRIRKLNLCSTGVSLRPLTKLLNNCATLEYLNLTSCRDLPRGMKRLYSNRASIEQLRDDIAGGKFNKNDSDN